MIFADEKRRLLEMVINHRIKPNEFVKFAHAQGVAAPDDMLKRWKERFYAEREIEYKESPRLINHFCVGADPEFVFGSKKGFPKNQYGYIHSATLGLTTIEAFGADMTGRQAELRAYPSRSVLHVVASLLDTLRHMVDACPMTYEHEWLAPGIFQNDGCGGHVHIGRKRPDRKKALSSLDKLTQLLIRANVVDRDGSVARMGATKYGKNGDIRPQPHGYEYRTMPTWMNSPWSAFLTLTLSKLCIFHQLNETAGPDLMTQEASKLTIENLLRTYAVRDDDARIALRALTRLGLPQYVNQDFKVNWAIQQPEKIGQIAYTERRRRYYYPPIIQPTELTCKELFMHLVNGNPLFDTTPKPNWNPFKLPPDLHKVMVEVHRPGLPEIAMGLLSKGYSTLLNTAPGGAFQVYVPVGLNLDKTLIKQLCQRLELPKVNIQDSDNRLIIAIPGNIANDYVVDKDKVARYRQFLVKSGLFPIAKAEDIDKLDLAKFTGKKKEPELLGSIVTKLEGMDPLQGGPELPKTAMGLGMDLPPDVFWQQPIGLGGVNPTPAPVQQEQWVIDEDGNIEPY